MPATPQSRASSARHNVTDVIARFDRASIEAVCRAGQLVALHFGTASGRVVVTVPAKDFTLSCRGPLDTNRNPLPNPEDFDEPREEAPIRNDSPKLAAVDDARSMSDDQRERFKSALKNFRLGRFKTKREAVEFYGLGHMYQGFVTWSNRPENQPATDGVRAFQFKPAGHPL
jgi:hypothetical protein